MPLQVLYKLTEAAKITYGPADGTETNNALL